MSISFDSTCAACLGDSPRLIVPGGVAGWSAYKCPGCGLVQTHPMPDDTFLNHYYQGFNFQPPREENVDQHLKAISRSLKFFVGKPKGSGRFLDFGGGSGIYCKAAALLEWQAELFDLDRNMLNFAQDHLKVRQTWNSLDQISNRTYEIIFAFHVIEHWNDIEAPLRLLLSLLEPGGRLVFATPNARSLEKFARRHHHEFYLKKFAGMGMEEKAVRQILNKIDSILAWDPPRHLFAFTPKSLAAIGVRFGLETEIFVGYNTNRLFEPRQYVYPPLLTQLRQLHGQDGGIGFQWPKVMKAFAGHLQMTAFRMFYPFGGEQLYVRYRKPKTG